MQLENKQVLITVKAYPNPSKKYGETVCCAGKICPMTSEEEIDDGIPFDEKMKSLTTNLVELFAKGKEMDKTILQNLKGIGYEF